MDGKVIAAAAIIILYLIYGIMMFFMVPGKDITIIFLGPAKMLWNLVFGFLGMVEI